MHLAICMPIYAGVETPALISILKSLTALLRYKPTCRVSFYHTERMPLWKARGTLWDMARYSNADRMIFLGEDIVINEDTLIRHAEAKYDIYSALYFERKLPYKAMVHELVGNGVWRAHNIIITGGVQKVDCVGLDCCSFSKEVLHKLDSNVFLPYHGSIGDDFSFCVHAKEAEFDIYVDTGHIVGHVEQKKKVVGLIDHITGIKTLEDKQKWVRKDK